MPRWDLIVVGGGLAGASLARAMATAGARVLVFERERRFRDRVRGEGMHPWGVAEARALGLDVSLTAAGAREVRYWTSYRSSETLRRRDLVETSPHRAGELTFYHPAMQEHLLGLAEDAGAEVRRGVTVTALASGPIPSVVADTGHASETCRARLVVAADGRQSRARAWGGFAVRREPRWLAITGVLEGGNIPADTISTCRTPAFGHSVLLFPLDETRCRVYFCTGRRKEHPSL